MNAFSWIAGGLGVVFGVYVLARVVFLAWFNTRKHFNDSERKE